MKKFNIIKKSRKKSEDIDEKIEYLDRELDKNGLREGMVTSKIYQGSTKEPNQNVSDFVALSQGGYPLGLSAADGNHLGNATLGTVSGSTGVALAPPHPVSGLRRSARHITSGLGDSTTLRPGVSIPIGFSDNPPMRTMGSALWFYDPNGDSGQGVWSNLEWGVQQGAWGFWDTVKTGQFTGIYFFNTNLSQHPSGDISNKITGINFDSNGAIGAPETIVLTQNDLGDPGFLPIDIPLSKQGFDYLLGKTGQYNYDERDKDDDFRNLPPEELANIFSEPESEKAQEAAVNIVSNEIKEKPELASKFEQFGKAGETFFRYVTGTLPETIDNEYLGEEYVNSMIAAAEPFYGDGVGNKLVFGDNILGTTQEPIRQGNTITVDFNYDFKTNAEELKGKGDQLNFMQRTFGEILANAFGAYSIDGSPKAFGPVLGGFGNLLDLVAGGFFSKFIETGKALGGAQHRPGKLTMDLSQIASENPKLLSHLFNQGLISYEELKTLREGGQLPEYDPSSEENFEYNKPSWFTFSSRTSDGRIFGYNYSGAFGELKLASSRGERGSMESGYGTRGYDFRTNSGGTSWTMDYDARPGDTATSSNTSSNTSKSDSKPKSKPYKPTPQGGRGGGQGNPTNRRGSGFPKEDVHYKSEGELLFETNLGHFDPEVLNVDIEQLRKGIMPEFPKDPPPDLINGYSSKSKLAPKTIEGEPFIKVTKKDLAKNHILKDSEIEKFMKQVDAINKYIKQNPAELKYAMIRYPKDDPRLAQLNFKLDQMKAASDEYMETHFPENESLFKKLQNKIKNNIEKTDPRRIDTSVPLVSEEEARIARERRLNVLERYKKQVDVKPFFNKKTPEIDWKIDYLNKELAKNGIDEAMRTSTVYTGQEKIPNTKHTDFNAAIINGQPLGISGGDGNGAGDAYVGEITTDMRLGHAYTGQKGVAISPPHPVTGQRRYATTQVGFAGVFAPLRPGSQQRGFPNTDYVSGGAIWYWNPYHNNMDGNPGLWFNLEYNTSNGKWSFWDTNFLGFFFLNQNLDQLEINGNPIGTQIKNFIQNIDFGNKGAIGTPETIVLTKDRLDDPSFIPIDIGGLSNQGYDYLKSKAKKTASSGVNYDLSNWINKTYGGAASNWYENNPSLPHQSNPHIPPAEAPYVPLASADSSTEFASAPPDAFEPETVEVEITPEDIPNEFKLDDNKPVDDSKPTDEGKGVKLTKWMSRTDYMSKYPNTSMVDYLNSLPYGPSDFMTPNPNFPGAWDLNTKGYENYFMNGDLSALGNRSGTPKPRHSTTTPDKAKKWGGKTKEEILAELDADIEKLTAAEKAAHQEMRRIALELGADFVSLIGGLFTGGTTAAPVLGKIGMKLLKKYGKTVAGKMIRKLVKRFRNKKNSQQLDDIIDAIEKGGNESGSVDLPDDGIGPRPVPPKPKKKIPDDMEYNWNPTGGSDGRGQWEVRDIPSTPKTNIPPKPKKKLPDGFNYRWDPNEKGGKGQWVVRQETYKANGTLLSEAAKLGHFEPEALTVDLEKLRKGILPEFPKDPPPKLINGYSEKSKLLPKTIEGEPYIKVDKKELTKNHRLKDSEIKEFMDEVNMINEYIKQNPAELIHAMQRYPKHDPRLAQLNWQMDQKLGASEEYMETHFPENKRLFNKLQTKIKQNIDLTDPDKFKNHKEAPKFVQNDISEQQRRKEVIIRHFKKKKKKRK